MMTSRLQESAAFSKIDYDRVRSQLVFRPSLVMNVLTLGTNLGLVSLVVWLVSRDHAGLYWLAQLLVPIAMFQAFALLHDCGHGSFSSSRLANSWVGHYVSVLCCMPYWPWTYVHIEHHIWVGNAERDPGLALVRRARAGHLPAILTRTWKTWLPVAAVAQHVVYWSYPLVELRRGKLPRARLARCAGSVALLVLAYTGLHQLAPTVFTVAQFAPGVLLYMVLVELVNLPHHVGLTAFDERLPLRQQHLPTRSCDYPPVVSELVVLNFNFHIEHHLFPSLPWYRLRTARNLLKPILGIRYREARGIRWLRRARKRELIDVLTHSADDFDSVRPLRADHGREVPT